MAQIWVLYEGRTKLGWTRKGRDAALLLVNRYRADRPSSTFTVFTGQEDRPLTRLWDFPPLTA